MAFSPFDADDVLSSITTGLCEATSQRPPLLGRDIEVKKLKYVWERVACGGGSSEVVTVCGPSGVGKSYLIETFRPVVECEGENQGIFVSNKFDQIAFKRSSRREPFYAVVSAFSDICEILKAKKDASAIGVELREEVGVEFELLCQFIPTLCRLSESTHEENDWIAQEEEFRWDTTVNKDDSLARICWAVTRLLNVAARRFPILLHFDDIHWADTESLKLIQALITDVESRSVLIALSHRDGVESTKVLSTVLDLQSSTKKRACKAAPNSTDFVTASCTSGPVRVTEIRLSNLSK